MYVVSVRKCLVGYLKQSCSIFLVIVGVAKHSSLLHCCDIEQNVK